MESNSVNGSVNSKFGNGKAGSGQGPVRGA
jgi:hypothetical protein